MAGKNTAVTVSLIGDASRLSDTFDKAEGKARGFGSKMGSILGAIGGVALAKGAFDFAGTSIEAFKESEKSANELAEAFKKFPALADSNAASFGKLNEALAKKTKFDDDATTSGQAVLAQFGLTGTQIQKLTPLLQDYAAKTGTDLPTAAEQLGKAMLGNGKALKQVGIDFKDAGSTGANFDQIMGGLRTQVGGFAESEGSTAAGKAAILSNQFGELQETVGSKLIPVITGLTSKLLTVINFFAALSPGVQTTIGVVIGLVGAALLITKAVQAWTAVQAALNVVMAMNPIGLVVVAIAALVAGVVWAYKNVGWFRDGVQGAFSAMATSAVWLGKVFSSIWDGIVAGFRWVRDTLKSIANWLITNVLNKMIDGVNLLLAGFNKVNFGQKDLPMLSKLPTFHSGGIVPGPTGANVPIMAQAGERVLSVADTKAGGGGTVINVYVEGVTTKETSDQIVRALDQHFARGGSLGNGRGGSLKPA